MKTKIQMYDEIVDIMQAKIDDTNRRMSNVKTHLVEGASETCPTAIFLGELGREVDAAMEIIREIEHLKTLADFKVPTNTFYYGGKL